MREPLNMHGKISSQKITFHGKNFARVTFVNLKDTKLYLKNHKELKRLKFD